MVVVQSEIMFLRMIKFNISVFMENDAI